MNVRKRLQRLDACARPRILLSFCSLSLSSIVFLLAPATVKSTWNSDYEPQVRNLVAGRYFVDDHGAVMYRYPPVYPLILAAVRAASNSLGFPQRTLLFLFAAVSIALSCLFVYGISRLVLPGPGAVISALVFAAHPQVLYGILIPLSETPFVAAFLAAVFCFLFALLRQPRRATLAMFISGLLGGLAILIRPAALLAPAIMVIAILLLGAVRPGIRLRQAVTLMLGTLLALLPWEVFVWQRSGNIVVVSSGGVPAMRDGFTFNKKAWRQHMWLPDGARWLSDEVWSSYPRLNSVADIASLLVKKARQRPLAVVQAYLFKAARSWYGTDSQKSRLELANALLALVFGGLAVIGLYRYMLGGDLRNNAGGLVLVGLALYFWGMTTTVLSIARYMVPAIGLLATFVPLALAGDASPVHKSGEVLNGN